MKLLLLLNPSRLKLLSEKKNTDVKNLLNRLPNAIPRR
jgi:hypothetical protein